MHIINRWVLSGLSVALLLISQQSLAAENGFDHAEHAKDHGGQIYQATKLESKWVRNEEGDGALQSKWETWIGTDENKLFLTGHAEKAESHDANYNVSALYSRNISDFWDVQAGVRYRYDKSQTADKQQYDAVLGLYGLVPYYFETEAYVYAGEDEQLSLSVETERDFLVTQKLIVQPYLALDVVLSDESKYAKETGISHVAAGIETRYEITRKFMPFIDVSYQYDRGNAETAWQTASSSEKSWLYGAGLRLKF